MWVENPKFLGGNPSLTQKEKCKIIRSVSGRYNQIGYNLLKEVIQRYANN